MEIINGFCEHLTQKELHVLAIRLANLSKYNDVLIDKICETDAEKTAFDQSVNDDSLADAIILYIFKKFHARHMSNVFNSLSCKQKRKFLEYYDAKRELARSNGFLADYDLTRNKMDFGIVRICNELGPLILLAFLYFAASPRYFMICALISYSFLKLINSKISASMQEALRLSDSIIAERNKLLIDSNLNWAKEELIKAGLLDERGRIITK